MWQEPPHSLQRGVVASNGGIKGRTIAIYSVANIRDDRSRTSMLWHCNLFWWHDIFWAPMNNGIVACWCIVSMVVTVVVVIVIAIATLDNIVGVKVLISARLLNFNFGQPTFVVPPPNVSVD
jgi:hypothetical protein